MIKSQNTARIWMLLALISLGAVFGFPLWQITLEAAQFPGGLKMYIWLDKISGNEKNIIQNVNILNHYIGMKPIYPELIPELKYFPLVAYGMIALGLLTLLIHKTKMYLAWAVLMTVLATLGIYDFYIWLYDYGHNLDPTAPIKIDGMSYMPPLFGEKDLLNFYVKSYPHWGGIFLGLTIILAFGAYVSKKKSLKKNLSKTPYTV